MGYALSASSVVVTEKAVVLAGVAMPAGLAMGAVAAGEWVLPVNVDARRANGRTGEARGGLRRDEREVTRITSSGSK